jgi:6,7-dimethyl-8-ribityllumazine synthase
MSEAAKVLIVDGRFYEDISDELCKGAMAVLDEAGMEYERLAVPGAFEIPQAIRFAGFGCVIRGETSQYDYVCQESSRALMDIVMQYSVALGYGIITVENRDQAWERADITKKNKGGDVAQSCLRMMEVKKHFRLVPR